jgi:hypothetical protein
MRNSLKPYVKGDLCVEIMNLAMKYSLTEDQFQDEILLVLNILYDAEKWRKRKNETTPAYP